MPYNVGPVVKQFRDAGLTAPIVGGDGYDTPDMIKRGWQRGQWRVVLHPCPDGRDGWHGRHQEVHRGVQQRIWTRSRERLRRTRLRFVYLLADAIKRAGSTDAQAIKKALEETKDFSGITGAITLRCRLTCPTEGRDVDLDQGRQIHSRCGSRPRKGTCALIRFAWTLDFIVDMQTVVNNVSNFLISSHAAFLSDLARL